MRLLPSLAAAAMVAGLATQPSSAQDYPTKDIRVIVPWGAGGGTDAIVRKISTIAEKELGGTIYVENIEGGISATGVMEVMTSRADGYTLGALTYDSVVTVPWQELLPSYELGKLKLVARITSEPDAIIVGKDAPYQSLDDLIAAAKKDPGTIKIGIQEIGSRTHLAMLRLQSMTDAKFNLIAYPGGAAPQKEALLSGEVDIVVTSLGDFAPLIESADARGLVEFSGSRNPTYPDVPTAQEAEIDLEMGSFIVLAAPAETPDEVVQKIEAAYKAAYDGDAFQDWVSKIGVTPSWLGSGEVTAWAEGTQETIFALMQDLIDQGVLKK